MLGFAWLAKGTMEDWVDRAAPIKTETLVIAAENDPEWGQEMQQRNDITLPQEGQTGNGSGIGPSGAHGSARKTGDALAGVRSHLIVPRAERYGHVFIAPPWTTRIRITAIAQ